VTCKVRFSEYFDITITPQDDWFDPVLPVDTELFIDPFLVFAYEKDHFVGSRGHVDDFYDCVQAKVLSSGGSSRSPSSAKAVDALHCPEVADLCLGYTAQGIMGAGIGRVLAQRIVRRMRSIPTHPHGLFGLLPLVSGIADDRISDATACLLREKLIKYTQKVCKRHRVKMSKAPFKWGYYDTARQKWMPLKAELPHNPFNKKPILLVPRRYLHPRLAIELYDFWDYCREHHDAKVREMFGSSANRRPTKAQLIKFATKHPKVWELYLDDKTKSPPQQYDFDRDPMGVVRWYDSTAKYCHQNPRRFKVNSEPLLRQAIDRMTPMFVDYIHNHQGWEMLYSDTEDPLPEKASRLLFLGTIMHCCAANKIRISREANIGRRTVEFTSPTGPQIRALLLVKFARNTKFWNSLERQLAKLLSKEKAELIRVMVILHSDRDLERHTRICDAVRDVKESSGYKIDVVWVNGRPR